MVGIMNKSNVCMLILVGLWSGLCTCSAWADDGASELAVTLRSTHVAQNVVSDSDETQADKDAFKDAIHDTSIPEDDETHREIASDGASDPSENTPNDTAQETSTSNAMASVFSPKPGYRVYKDHHPMTATIETTKGTLCCDLFIDDHPMTVLNFKALSAGKPAWTDRSGNVHHTPYYDDLHFSQRERGAFVVSGERVEGTDFYVKDERCAMHHPVAGSLVMVQPHPNAASTRFMILARDIPEFYGMYTVFGQCSNMELIQSLSSEDATINHIQIKDKTSCKK